MRASDRFADRPVCFSPGDYAGFWCRLTAELVDLCAVAILGIVVTAIVVVAAPAEAPGDAVLLSGLIALVYG